jgi:hypothetical protein
MEQLARNRAWLGTFINSVGIRPSQLAYGGMFSVYGDSDDVNSDVELQMQQKGRAVFSCASPVIQIGIVPYPVSIALAVVFVYSTQ